MENLRAFSLEGLLFDSQNALCQIKYASKGHQEIAGYHILHYDYIVIIFFLESFVVILWHDIWQSVFISLLLPGSLGKFKHEFMPKKMLRQRRTLLYVCVSACVHKAATLVWVLAYVRICLSHCELTFLFVLIQGLSSIRERKAY